jgi:hypothetical protein
MWYWMLLERMFHDEGSLSLLGEGDDIPAQRMPELHSSSAKPLALRPRTPPITFNSIQAIRTR